jgi:hypothetical protein
VSEDGRAKSGGVRRGAGARAESGGVRHGARARGGGAAVSAPGGDVGGAGTRVGRGGAGQRLRCQRRGDEAADGGVRHGVGARWRAVVSDAAWGHGVRDAMSDVERRGVRRAAVTDTYATAVGGWRNTRRRRVWRQGGAPQGLPYAALRLGKDAPPPESEQ